MKTSLGAWATSLCLLVMAVGVTAPGFAQTTPPAEKVFRYAFNAAETGFDPPQLSDLYSRIVTGNIFETLYGYEYLTRPIKIRPVLAEGMPEVSADFRTYTIRMRRGVYFSDEPAFGGKKREVTAQDVVYTIKRVFDPKLKSPVLSEMQEERIVGLNELAQRMEGAAKFDYDTEVEGLRALDRYTVQIKLTEPRPRFIYKIADPGVLGVVAREVVEKYGDSISEHPVGTGAFMLSEWRRASKITLVRNPNYHSEIFNESAPPDDPLGQEIARHLKGKRLPLVDKVVISIVDEPQPRWLAFLNREHDLMWTLPNNFAPVAIPNSELAPNLRKKGIRMERVPLSDVTMFYFNMDDPVWGGYAPEKVALRRAFALAYNDDDEIRARRGQAVAAQGFVSPGTASYDAKFRTEMARFDRARAKALLDMYGYTDKNGDGWRDMPDGSPLVLTLDTLGQQDYRERDEFLKRNMDAIGIRVNLRIGQWPEQLKAGRAGKLQMWSFGLSATSPDSSIVLQQAYGPSAGEQNLARFKNKRYDELYRKQLLMPDGPERDAVIAECVRILVAYMPYKTTVHRIGTDMWHPWLIGWKRHPFARDFWRYMDVDESKLPH